MSIIISVLVKRILLIKNRYPKISVQTVDKARINFVDFGLF